MVNLFESVLSVFRVFSDFFICTLGREIQAELLLTVVDRQNLALSDALRLVGILREMAAKRHPHHGEYVGKKPRHVGSLEKKWAHSDGDLNAFVQMS